MRNHKKLIIVIGVTAIMLGGGVGYLGALNGWWGGGGNIPTDTFTRGLVGYWAFEEGSGTTANDASGSGNNGTLTNGPKWASGKVGGALQFDGVDDYVDAGANSSTNITGAITIEAWIYLRSYDVDYRTIVGKSAQNWFRVEESPGNLRFYLYQGAVWKNISSTENINLNTWYHVVATYDNSTGKLFINGLDKSGASSLLGGGADSSSGILYISRSSGIGPWDGLIDDVRIYNRALSATEIRYHYNRGGPVGYWKFDEGSGDTAYDESNNNNDGNLAGTCPGGSTCPTWVAGKYGSALSFDGTDDYVLPPDNSILKPTTAITFESWIKTSANSVFQYIYAYRLNGIRFYLSSGQPGIELYTATAGDHGFNWPTSIADGSWHHYSAVYDTSLSIQNIKLYIDGVLRKTGNWTEPILYGSGYWAIGRAGNLASEHFNGLIDDVRIYNYARTTEQIYQDYNQGLSTHFK